MTELKVLDCNGNELRAGSKVRHVVADQIHDWGQTHNDWPTLKDGSVPCCVPFRDVHTVIRPVTSTCVELDRTAASIPVFLGCVLERVG